MTVAAESELPGAAVSRLANRVRFRVLTANFAVTVIATAFTGILVPFIVQIRLKDLASLAPFVMAIIAIAGVTQIFLNERDFQKIVLYSNPDRPEARELEPIHWVVIRMLLVLSLIGMVFIPGVLWAYNVTVADMIRIGMTGIVNLLIADVVVVIILAIGLILHARLRKDVEAKAPEAHKHVHPIEVKALADNFAMRAALVSTGLWGFGAVSGALVALLILHWGDFFALFILTVTAGIGIAVFPFQYFVFRWLFGPLRREVIKSLSRSYEVASLHEASHLMQGDVLEKGRILVVVRLLAGVFTAAALFIFGDAIPAYMFWTGIGYAAAITVCLALTFTDERGEQLSEGLRLLADGVALILLIQFAGSMTTPAPGIFFVIIFSVCLHKSYEAAMVVTIFFSAMYGSILVLEYLGIIPYAPFMPDNLLLDTILSKGLWANYGRPVLFAMNFTIVAGGMLLSGFIGRHYRRRFQLDRDEQEDLLDKWG